MMDRQAQQTLLRGVVIPAHPLALTAERKLDERRQRALTRYYCDAGAGGLAVGVHTTQFAIRDVKVGLFEPVLQLAYDTMREWEQCNGNRLVKIAGICGPTHQACGEARLAHTIGYDAGLLSLAAMREATNATLLEHCRAIAAEIPLVGFYLQPAVGGRVLDYEFWRAFLDIEQVVAIKVAPFNRYHTIDVARALADSGRAHEVALYTGNDDHIVEDLLTEFRFGERSVRFVGGLLGHWAVWTQRAVELLEAIHACQSNGGNGAAELLARAAAITDANAVLFDARNHFAGCIAGLHEVLRRQGLLAGRWCLDPREDVSPGQVAEIDRIYQAYPQLNDDAFVAAHLERWLS